MKKIRMEIKLRNNVMISKREELGLTQIQAAKFCNVRNDVYAKLENLMLYPKDSDGNWIKPADKIAKSLIIDINELFAADILAVKKSKIIRAINSKDVNNYMIDVKELNPQLTYDNIEITKQVDIALKTLTPKEEKIMRLRFGIGENKEHTLKEIAEKFDVNCERIRQIQTRSIQKLKRKSRYALLSPFEVH